MIARASRNIFNEGGARGPSSANMPSAKANICRSRDGPTPQRLSVVPVAGEVDECRARHTAQCPITGNATFDTLDSSPSTTARLTSSPDEHEEDRGQPVVNPQPQGLGDGETTDLDRDREIQKLRYKMSRAAGEGRFDYAGAGIAR